MLRKLRTKLSLMLNRKTLTTHQFGNSGLEWRTRFMGAIWGHTNDYDAQINRRVWAEAKPIGANEYVVTQKKHNTHHRPFVLGKSGFSATSVSGTFNGERKTIFTHDEAVKILENQEKSFAQQGYSAREKQPFKKRIYTQVEAKQEEAKRFTYKSQAGLGVPWG